MTEAEALSKMKRKCLVLSQFFNDADLTGFLDDYKTGEGTDASPYVYDVRRSTYDALTSALTTMEQSTTRGGVTTTYADLFKIRRQFATAGVISLCGNSGFPRRLPTP
ncbi:hypothetical protein Ga0466249_004831 [Sporomusaceae bacterium BoRhaA]|uniref:hypothetical protein n=1 Tax=Pelorhabdus rhamnosifermentans TaxID=2772457 RepID=UPI001FE5DD6B|nr:hypothetical protein [Pelorhabdus rhamnosifermentans]MBU2703683.1 hypothetical protein [Pelorhabdus rhamnosifermentans]